MSFAPKTPNYETIVRESFAQQTFLKTLGAELTAVEPGRITISYERDEGLLQQHGFLHAGVATTVVDTACGYSALSLAPEGHEVLTSEFKVNFLRPASGRRFVGVGAVLKPGRMLTVCEGEVIDADSGALIAKMSASMVTRKPD